MLYEVHSAATSAKPMSCQSKTSAVRGEGIVQCRQTF